jgi:hypothetical protein
MKMSYLPDSEEEDKVPILFHLEDIAKETKLLKTWHPANILLWVTVHSQEFDCLRTDGIFQCLWCRKEFDPSNACDVNIHNVMLHASRNLHKNLQVPSSKGKDIKVSIGSSKAAGLRFETERKDK